MIENIVKACKRNEITDIAHETLKTFSLTHNYNIWIINLLAPYMGKKILEIGCGIGNLTYHLQNFGTLSCLDISDYYLAHMKIDFPDIGFYNYDIVDDKVIALSREGFDTVICVNVLEHIQNDKKALQNIHAILKPQGKLLLYVPALRFLYGSVDCNLSHIRRYDKKSLGQLLIDVGFKVEKLSYSNFIGIFGWFFNSRIQQKRELSYWQTILFDKFVPFIQNLEKRFKPPIGMSLLAIAKK